MHLAPANIHTLQSSNCNSYIKTAARLNIIHLYLNLSVKLPNKIGCVKVTSSWQSIYSYISLVSLNCTAELTVSDVTVSDVTLVSDVTYCSGIIVSADLESILRKTTVFQRRLIVLLLVIVVNRMLVCSDVWKAMWSLSVARYV